MLYVQVLCRFLKALTRLKLSRYLVIVPKGLCLHHRIEADQELTHTGDNRYLLALTLLEQMLIIRPNSRIRAQCRKCRYTTNALRTLKDGLTLGPLRPRLAQLLYLFIYLLDAAIELLDVLINVIALRP